MYILPPINSIPLLILLVLAHVTLTYMGYLGMVWVWGINTLYGYLSRLIGINTIETSEVSFLPWYMYKNL